MWFQPEALVPYCFRIKGEGIHFQKRWKIMGIINDKTRRSSPVDNRPSTN